MSAPEPEVSAAGARYLVFSDPPEGVSDEEFNAWYEIHLREILETPGFLAVQRYRLRAIVAEAGDPTLRYLAVWEVSGDIVSLRAELAGRSERGEMTIPPWFAGLRFRSWACEPFGQRLEVTGPTGAL